MNARKGRSSILPWLLSIAGGVSLSAQASEATVTIVVNDRDGRPVEEVVVYAVPLDGRIPDPGPAPDTVVTMNQINEQFTPHVIVTQTGSAVAFPNSDHVSHHVYSFSAPKQFELPLYQGSAHPPVMFDRPGVVDVGCNIHDHMEAHIVIVDTPYFAITGADGRAELPTLPDGEYELKTYTPRLRPADLPAPQRLSVGLAGGSAVQIQFADRLRPAHHRKNGSLSWSRY